jgi:hypothetical protein
MKEWMKTTLAKLLASVLPKAVMTHPAAFAIWERAGYHVTPVHFYSPIPDLTTLTERGTSSCPGVDLNRRGQEAMLATLAPLFPEARACWEDNTYFGLVDSAALYAMVRHHRPQKVVEVGSGYSTRMARDAIERNGSGELITIEPFPQERMPSAPTYPVEVQRVPLDLFESLEENDILFIDSSHVLRTGGDVKYEYLEILPRLAAGVLVHVHDVFIPDDYPLDWFTDRHRFWSEQYLLQAFLAFNEQFEVLWSSHMLDRQVEWHLPHGEPGGSFWLRRVGSWRGRRQALVEADDVGRP